MKISLGIPTVIIGTSYAIFANINGYPDFLGYILVGVGVAWIDKYIGEGKK